MGAIALWTPMASRKVVMPMRTKQDIQPPPAYRLMLAVGQPLGLRWVGDYQLAVVYKMEQYHDVRGPGFFWINRWTQTMRSVISLAPDMIKITLAKARTRDGVPMDVAMALAYTFDPRDAPKDKAALFVNWSLDVRRGIVTNNAQRAIQFIMPEFYAEQVCRGEVMDALEEKFSDKLTTRLQPLALKPMLTMVQEVIVPPDLQSRLETIVGRGVDARDLSGYEPFELTQARISQMLDVLSGSGVINTVDLAELMTAVRGEGQSPPRVTVRPAPALDQGPPPSSPPPPPSKPKSRL